MISQYSMATENMQTGPQLDITVVGAGLGGLSCAIASRLAGHRVTIYESAAELREVGAGLQVTPNAIRILQKWGMPSTLWKAGAEPTTLSVHRYDGTVLAHEDDFNVNMRRKYGAPFLDYHRVDLQLALIERATELGVSIKLGHKVTNIDLTNTELTCLSTEGEEKKARSDLIVAADGLWSKCRSIYTGDNDDLPLPTGDLAYRIVLKADEITDPELQSWVRNPAVHFWIGPGAHAVGYSLKGGEMYNIVLLVPDDLPQGASRQEASVDEMRALFEGWDPILTRFLAMVDGVDKWKLMHRKELANWVSKSNNLVFVGDSCHPMLPYLAQGANSAIEDGAVLGISLSKMKSRSHLPQALSIYQRLRKTRGDAIVKETFKQRHDFHLPDGPEQEERDRVFKAQLGKEITGEFPSRWTCPTIQPWLYGYDPWQEVDTAEKQSPFPPAEDGEKHDDKASKSWTPFSSIKKCMSWILSTAKL